MDNNKTTKKEKLLEYKQRKIIGGVYAIKNNANGKMFLQSAVNLKGIKNRFDFSIMTNSCINQKLQKDWNEFGKESFTFEVLEELEKKEEQTEKEFQEDVKVLEELWISKLKNIILY